MTLRWQGPIKRSSTARERRAELQAEADERLAAAVGPDHRAELAGLLDRLADTIVDAADAGGRGPLEDRVHRLSWMTDEALACRLDRRTDAPRSRVQTFPHFPTWSDVLAGGKL
jgi:hypothetical protein